MGVLFLLVFLLSGYVDPFAIIIAYFLESVIIGILNFTKILFTNRKLNQSGKNGSVGFKAFFFLIHYSFFIFVQSIFVFAMFSATDKNIKEPFNIFDNFAYAFTIDGFGLSMAIMTGVLIMETYVSYIKPQLYKNTSADDLFFKPYIRVLIQQFTVIIASFFVLITGLEVIAAITLIIFRLLVDLCGVYITSSDDNLRRAAYFIKKNHTRSDIKAIEELKKYL